MQSLTGAVSGALVNSVSGAANQLVKQAQGASTKLMSQAQAALADRLGGAGATLAAATTLQKGALKKASGQQLKNLAESKLASTIFKAGPRDDLQAVDVLGISDTNIRNSLTGKLTGFASNLLSSFKNSGVTNLTSLMQAALGGNSFSADALKDRVMASLGGTSGMIRMASDALGDTLTQGYGIDPAIYSQVEGVVNNVAWAAQTDQIKDANTIFNIVNQITGQKELAQFFDVGAEANLLSGLFNQAISLGVPNAIDALYAKSKSNTAADYALRSNVQVAVLASDLATTDLMVDKLGLNRINADLPNAAALLIANYKLPVGMTDDQLDAELAKLVTTLGKLEPGWGTYSRNGVATSDLGLYTHASADARLLLSRDEDHLVAMTVGAAYQPVNMLDQAKQMYPFARL